MYRTAMMTATLAMTATGPQVSVIRSGPSHPAQPGARRQDPHPDRLALRPQTWHHTTVESVSANGANVKTVDGYYRSTADVRVV